MLGSTSSRGCVEVSNMINERLTESENGLTKKFKI